MIGKILLKNYRKLMSEDTPMRDRKGRLRKIGHHFFLQTQPILSIIANKYLNQMFI